MNVKVLNAISKIFAIVAKADGFEESEKNVIKSYLHEHFSDRIFESNYQKFENYLLHLNPDENELTKICKEINQELDVQQKVVAVLKITELVFADQIFSETEQRYLDIICSCFYFSDSDRQDIIDFIQFSGYQDQVLGQALIIGHKPLEGVDRFIESHAASTLVVKKIGSYEFYFLKLLNQGGNTFLNGELLKQGECYAFTKGSVIKIENHSAVYFSQVIKQFRSAQDLPQVLLEVDQVNFRYEGGEAGLHDVNFQVQQGSMVAIMGASGSGKSTLLNVMNGTIKPKSGAVKINGKSIHQHIGDVKGLIGFVPQDDLLVEPLTVYENLFFAAKLAYGGKTDQEIGAMVLKTLDDVGILEKKDNRVGTVLNNGISGGQRKRLNIALELIREPTVLYVDEPTSGLSSRDSEKIMDLLYDLAQSGKIVFSVIHQPSSDIFKIFDDLLILDKDGFPIFFGNPVEAVTYFKTQANHINSDAGACESCGNVNPEVIFNIIENKVIDEFGNPTSERKLSPQKWHERYLKFNKQTPKSTQPALQTLSKLYRRPDWFTQLIVFFQRDVLSKWKSKSYLAINLAVAPILAIILAVVVRYFPIDQSVDSYYRFFHNVNVPSYLFISIIICLFMGLIVSADEIYNDAKILAREKFLNLSRSSYLLAKIAVLALVSVYQAGVFTLLGNAIMGLKGLDIQCFLILFSCSLFANLLGLNISSGFKSVVQIYIIIPLLLIPQMILGGIIVDYDNINPILAKPGKVPFIAQLMSARWGYEGLMTMQFTENGYGSKFFEVNKAKAEAGYKDLWRQKLENLFDEVIVELNKKNAELNYDKIKYSKLLAVIKSEMEREGSQKPILIFSNANKLVPQEFDLLTANNLSKHLFLIEEYYRAQSSNADKARKMYIDSRYSSNKNLNLEKEKYHNQYLEDLVRNKASLKEGESVVVYGNKLEIKTDPIYREPESSIASLNAHFFAPLKYIFGIAIPTWIFNMIVVHGMSLLLYFTLYFNLLDRFLLFTGFNKKGKF